VPALPYCTADSGTATPQLWVVVIDARAEALTNSRRPVELPVIAMMT
jgi:hypothetical protein